MARKWEDIKKDFPPKSKIRFSLIQVLWDVGQKFKEWACVLSGGTHDYATHFAQGEQCIVCGHRKEKPPITLVKQ